ncbi:MAG: maleylpyruvate isomerase family mycothiol-dependent enzyme [Acidimicrobiales bacterium]
MPQLSSTEYRQFLSEETTRLRAISPDHLDIDLPHIEGWTVGTVIGHTGWVFRYVTLALAATPDQPPRRADVPEPPLGEAVLDWFADGADALMAAFDAVDLERIVPTFTGPQPARWWLRRLAHETAMHRWDAESAIRSPQPIDPALARDGVDEVFETFAPTRLSFDALAGTGEVIHLHATDIDDGEWLVTLGPTEITWTTGHAKGDVAARGPVSDLLLALWSRLPPSRLELFGDASLLDRWQAATTF